MSQYFRSLALFIVTLHIFSVAARADDKLVVAEVYQPSSPHYLPGKIVVATTQDTQNTYVFFLPNNSNVLLELPRPGEEAYEETGTTQLLRKSGPNFLSVFLVIIGHTEDLRWNLAIATQRGERPPASSAEAKSIQEQLDQGQLQIIYGLGMRVVLSVLKGQDGTMYLLDRPLAARLPTDHLRVFQLNENSATQLPIQKARARTLDSTWEDAGAPHAGSSLPNTQDDSEFTIYFEDGRSIFFPAKNDTANSAVVFEQPAETIRALSHSTLQERGYPIEQLSPYYALEGITSAVAGGCAKYILADLPTQNITLESLDAL